MKNNPLAAVIRSAYIKNVVKAPLQIQNQSLGKNTLENILRHKRMVRFEQAIHRFLENCGQKPVPCLNQYASEKELLTFSLQLSGYIRDGQKALANLTSAQAHDKDLIDLYKAAAKYSCDCNGMIEGSKYVFHEHCDYQFWKIRFADKLENSKFNNFGFSVDPHRHNLILAMPFHIGATQEELQQWTSKFMGSALDNRDIFGSAVDVYLAHFPIEQPRGEKFALALETLRSPEDFYHEADMTFVLKNLSKFIAEGLEVDAKHQVIRGKPYSDAAFADKCKNLTLVGYCAGGAHAHRWLNAFYHVASQMYEPQAVTKAMQNIFVLNYAFLPPEVENKYSGVHFMSNYAEDTLRKEPFVKMFSPELYEKVKYQQRYYPARKTVMPDKRNLVLSCCLPENLKVCRADGQAVLMPNLENGHHMGVVTQPQVLSVYSWARQQFRTVLQNASLGCRGRDVFCQAESKEQRTSLLLVPQAYHMQKIGRV